jgi:hypothetical protein
MNAKMDSALNKYLYLNMLHGEPRFAIQVLLQR